MADPREDDTSNAELKERIAFLEALLAAAIELQSDREKLQYYRHLLREIADSRDSKWSQFFYRQTYLPTLFFLTF